MGVIGWIIIGGLAGWIASLITGTSKKFGIFYNILIGIAGAFIGGLVFGYVTDPDKAFDFGIWSFLIALGGAIVLLLLLKLIFKKTLSGGEKFTLRKTLKKDEA